uniref:Uncharacterized protein n=1 Tax=viral metagenome TaxID=1070528 RepID=A0A6C0JEZ6_9ZZZZ
MKFIVIQQPREMDYRNEEEKYMQLQYVIEAKRDLLLKKQHKLHKIAKQNAFLEHIKNDYSNYNNYIVKQKQDQITALQLLNNYIDELNRSGHLSEHNIQDSKMEQNKILKELKSIKQGLDKIMNDSHEINNSLISKNIKYNQGASNM